MGLDKLSGLYGIAQKEKRKASDLTTTRRRAPASINRSSKQICGRVTAELQVHKEKNTHDQKEQSTAKKQEALEHSPTNQLTAGEGMHGGLRQGPLLVHGVAPGVTSLANSNLSGHTQKGRQGGQGSHRSHLNSLNLLKGRNGMQGGAGRMGASYSHSHTHIHTILEKKYRKKANN